MRLTSDSPSFTPVHSQIRAIGPRVLHLAKGRGRSELGAGLGTALLGCSTRTNGDVDVQGRRASGIQVRCTLDQACLVAALLKRIQPQDEGTEVTRIGDRLGSTSQNLAKDGNRWHPMTYRTGRMLLDQMLDKQILRGSDQAS